MRYRLGAMPSRHHTRTIPATLAAALGAGLVAYGLYHQTRWYREGNQLFYRDRRPTRAGKVFGSIWVAVNDRGLGPDWSVSLETVGRTTGRRSSIPLVLADWDGERYAVSMLGERSPWVHNVRASGGEAVLRHRRAASVRLVEVPPEGRAPIIKAYLARAAGGRPHIPVDKDAPLAEFEAIAADFPVFRVQSIPDDGVPIKSVPDGG